MESYSKRVSRVMLGAPKGTQQRIRRLQRLRIAALVSLMAVVIIVAVLLAMSDLNAITLVAVTAVFALLAAIVEYKARDAVLREDNLQQIFRKTPRH